MRKLSLKSVIVVLAITIIALIFLKFGPFNGSKLEWTMVNVNQTRQQGDAHLIRVKNGKTILVDTGHRKPAETALIPFLTDESIDTIDTVFISHPHKDHYGGLEVLLENNIKISEIYFNIPIKSVCDKEIPWGCNYDEIVSLHELLKNNGVTINRAEAGQSFVLGKNTKLDLLYAYDGLQTPVGETDVNDLSLIMMLYHNQFKFLFTGDLNWKIGGHLAKMLDSLSADILKVPHHGAESTAPNNFFAKVSPQYGLVPAPQHLWLSDRSKRIRKWFKINEIPVFVNGIDGNIRIVADGKNLRIDSENKTNM